MKDRPEPLVLQEVLGPPDLPELQATLELLEQRGRLVLRVRLVLLAALGLPDPLA